MLSCRPQVGQGHVANGTRENVWPRSGLQSPLFAMGVLSLLTLRLRLTRCINWPDLRHSTSSSSYCSVAHGLLTVDVWDVLDWRTLAEQQVCRSEKSTTWRNTRNWEWFLNIYLLIYSIKLVWIIGWMNEAWLFCITLTPGVSIVPFAYYPYILLTIPLYQPISPKYFKWRNKIFSFG